MYAAHHLFADEMRALLTMSSFLSAAGVLGFFVSVVFDALVHTTDVNPTLATWDTAIDAALHAFSPTFLAMRLLAGTMSRRSGDSDWVSAYGGGSIAWLCAQAVLNMAVLLLASSGIVGDLLHMARAALAVHAPMRSQRLLQAGRAEDSNADDQLARGPSSPLLVSGDITASFEHDAAAAHRAPAPVAESSGAPVERAKSGSGASQRQFASWASLGGFGTLQPHSGALESSGRASSVLRGVSTALAEGVREHADVVAYVDPAAYMVLLRRVSKVFGSGWCDRRSPTIAVHDVSLAVPQQHCFGLLGTGSHSVCTPACVSPAALRCMHGRPMCRHQRRWQNDDIPDAHPRAEAHARRCVLGRPPHLWGAVAPAQHNRLLPAVGGAHHGAECSRGAAVLRSRSRPAPRLRHHGRLTCPAHHGSAGVCGCAGEGSVWRQLQAPQRRRGHGWRSSGRPRAPPYCACAVIHASHHAVPVSPRKPCP
jgi:hypothetical protein